MNAANRMLPMMAVPVTSPLMAGSVTPVSPSADHQHSSRNLQTSSPEGPPSSSPEVPPSSSPEVPPSTDENTVTIATSESHSETELSTTVALPRAPRETEALPRPPRAPDGGWGWLVVLGSFLIHVVADGLVYSFGVFYIEFLHDFGSSKGETSLVASLCVGVSFTVGPIASVLVTRYDNRVTAILGTMLAAAGFFISAWSPNVYFLYFTYGILAGCGFGLLMHPAIVVVNQYFDKRRSLATGVAICGSGVGTFLFPPLVQSLVETYSWQGTSLILSAVILNCAVCGALFRPLTTTQHDSTENINLDPSKNLNTNNDELENIRDHDSGPIVVQSESGIITNKRSGGDDMRSGGDPITGAGEDKSLLKDLNRQLKQNARWKLLRDPSFLLFALSGTLTSIGYNAPFLFLPHHAELHGIEPQRASFLISVIGITSILGRVICGYIGDKIGEKRLYAFCLATIVNGLCTALCPLCVTYTTLVMYAAAYGFTMGAYMAYNWVLLVDLMGLENLSASLGLVMMFDGISAPVGPPLLGWVFDVTGTYNTSFVIGGIVIILAGLVLIPIPCIKRIEYMRELNIDNQTAENERVSILE